MVQDRNRPGPSTALTNALVGVAAGAGGALLFFLAARGTWAGMLLSYFAPLPPMIATIGFGGAVGGGAVLVGALLAGVLGAPLVGLAVGGGLLLPAYLVGVAAMRARAVTPDDRRVPHVVLVSIVFAFVSAAAVVVLLVAVHGGVASARTAVTASITPLLRSALPDTRLSGAVTVEELAGVLVGLAPAIIAVSTFFMLVVNAYIAGRVAMISGRLSDAWPPVAETLVLPPFLAGVFAVACALVFLGGLPGVVASIAVGAVGSGLALEGLAVVHLLTRGMSVRTPILVATYALILVIPPWPMFFLALVGFADAAFHLRQRPLFVSKNPNRME